jgi:hypothetical protein
MTECFVGGDGSMNTDSHLRDVENGIADLLPKPEEMRFVRIYKNARTVRKSGLRGANRVVVIRIPARVIAKVNPARLVVNCRG